MSRIASVKRKKELYAQIVTRTIFIPARNVRVRIGFHKVVAKIYREKVKELEE